MRTSRDQSSSDFLGSLKNLAKGFLAWASEEGAEGEHGRSAAGSMMVAPDGRVLFTRRAPGRDHAGSWAFPAGMSESEDADPQATALREAREEVGAEYGMDPRGMLPIDRRQTNGLDFHTYLMPVEGTFQPTLNDEHDGFQWSHLGDAPQPLHPGVAATIQDFAMDPLTEKGRKIMASMQQKYGEKKGKSVFYASKNAGKIEGVDDSLEDRFELTPGGLQIVDKKSGQLYDVDDAMRALTSRAKVLPDQRPASTLVAGKVQETKVTEPKPSFNVGKFETERVPRDAAPYGLGRFEATDEGTSEGARKAAATRKARGGGSAGSTNEAYNYYTSGGTHVGQGEHPSIEHAHAHAVSKHGSSAYAVPSKTKHGPEWYAKRKLRGRQYK